MKNIKSILIIISIITVQACSEDFIELAPISNANVDIFFKSQGDFESAIVGAYATLASSGTYHDYMQLIGDLRSDNTEMGTTASVRFPFFDMSEFRDQVTSTIFNNVWNHHFQGISRANLILEKIDEIELSETFEQRIVGESRFLRALFYFNLVRVFGDVPLLSANLNSIEEAYSIGRTDQDLVYDQIIEDLIFAESVLPIEVRGEAGRATKGAAMALLGKVYLTLHEYEKAGIKLKEVIDADQYGLMTNYEDLWMVENKNHKESIFDVQFSRSSTFSTGSDFVIRYTPYLYTNLPYYSTGGGYNIPTEDLINAYEENDLRKNASLREFYVTPNNDTIDGLEGRYCIKFYNMPTLGQGSDDNWPVIRYADVLLMYAEALNEISFQADGEAFTYLNEIRNRAGLPDKTAGNPNQELRINTQDEFRLAIEQERRVELAFEGHRWFDLVRTGRAIEVLNPKVNDDIQVHQLLLPIPQTQIDINPRQIKQNPGY
ncbi:MAG: RagB/SusD family nutrient uptake outer membrane protein [Cyclobacteriaceae bacterium]